MPIMAKTLDEVAKDAANLTEQDRLKLARMMLDVCEIEGESLGQVQAEWDKELEARLAQLRSGKVEAVSLEEVRSRIEDRFHW